jgi:two-component system chemotaxis sensor kinase CheA
MLSAMDSNQQRFVEDALDLLNELDEGLLQLEANPQASAPLEQVFRTMHTIKGGANMFGFNHIGELAHHFETIYDVVREGKTQVNDTLISITLHAFDKVRDLFKEKEVDSINNAEALRENIKAANNFLQQLEHDNPDILTGGNNGSTKVELATFYISVSPTANITADGTHPLVFIMQDIAALGSSRIKLAKRTTGEVIQWQILIATTTTLAELESYFIFIENECTVTYNKLAPCDLFEQPKFIEYLDSLNDQPVEISKLISIIDTCKVELTDESENEDALSGKKISKQAGHESYIKVSKRKVDDLLNWISELIILQAQLSTTAAGIQNVLLTNVSEQLETITAHLRDTTLEIGLVPIETQVTKFKRLIRDLSKQLGKKVNFISEGADTEMDKDVIELMTEPMIHIIRNAIDHGIETPSKRKASGKSEHGIIKLKAFNSNTYANIIISDDGKGIDAQAVLAKAVERGLIAPDVSLTEEAILNLIFHPGLSTADKISDVSGRGVGMDVVQQKINELRGSVAVKSSPGKGTSIHVKLPLSRSIIEGFLVRVGQARYIVPLNVVERIDRISSADLDTEDHLNKTVLVNNEMLSVISLRKSFQHDTQAPKTSDIISIAIDGVKRGLAVDRIEGKIQAVLKPLGDLYQQQDYLAGSTILGDGTLALVLDPQRLFKSIQ